MDAQALTTYPWYRVRSAQYDEIYVSPHMDDAVYSCGGQIALERARGKRILIVTVFGNGNADSDAPSGEGVFGDMVTRKREERAAAELLDVDHLWLNYPDLLVRPKRIGELVEYALPFVALSPDALQARLFAALHPLIARLRAPAGRAYFPLAIGSHPDHRIVHAVGRAVAAHDEAVWFYEDIPYAQVPALRDDRLRHLGLARPSALWSAARQIHRFAFAHAPAWQQPLARIAVTAHTLITRVLFRLFGDKTPQLAERDLQEREIDAVLDRKIAAMRAYATQTAFFYPEGAALKDALVRSGGRYVERYWRVQPYRTPSSLPAQAETHLASERAKLDALLRELPS